MTVIPNDLRSAQLAETKRRIALAVAELIAERGAAELSFPAVAEQAGVSLRTVYRHFPNKERLAAAALQAGSDRALAAYAVGDLRLDDLRPFLTVLWRELMENQGIVMAQQMTPSGRSLRGERMRIRQADVRRAIERDDPQLTDADTARLAAICTALMSSALMLDLVEQLGVDVDEAAALASFAIEAVLERARREGEIR